MVAVPVGAGLLVAAGAWGAPGRPQRAGAARRTRVRSGAEGLCGTRRRRARLERARGQVYRRRRAVARAPRLGPGEETGLHEGDAVVVERVAGLTLCVRRADEWELIA